MIWLAVGLALTAFIRIWLAPILLAPLAVFLVFGTSGVGVRIVFGAVVAAAFVYAVELLSQDFSIMPTDELLTTTDLLSRSWAYGGSAQQVQTRFNNLGSIVAFLPIGAFTALFRPLPGEVMNSFGTVAGLENLALLLLLAYALVRTRLYELKDPLILWAIFAIVIWAGVYGFISYQNLGSAVRYKLQILPIMVPLLAYLARRRDETHEMN